MYFRKFIFGLLILTTACVPNNATPPPMPAVHFLIDNQYTKFLWSNYHPTTILVGTPDRILGLRNFKISAFDSKTGKVAWEEKTEYISEMVAQDSIVYMAKYNRLQAVDSQNGKFIWETKDLGTGNALSVYVNSMNIFVHGNSGRFVVLDTKGEFLNSPISDWTSYLVLENGTLYYTGANGLNAFDINTNQNKWTVKLEDGFGSKPVITENAFYIDSEVLSGTDTVWAIDKSTGNVIWKWDKFARIISNLCILDKNIYFLTADGYLIALDLTGGQEVMKLGFSNSPFVLYRSEESQVYEYYIASDTKNKILAIAFGDSFQLMAIQFLNP